jgi:hypothetical protein
MPIGTNFALPDLGALAPVSTGMPAVPVAKVGFTSPLAAIKNYISTDEGQRALFRSGVATINGGIGAGLQAAATDADHQEQERYDRGRQAHEDALADGLQRLRVITQQQDHDLGQQKLGMEGLQLAETSRHNMAGEGNTRRSQDIDIRGQDVTRANALDGNATSRANSMDSNAQSDKNSQRSFDASVYGTNVGALNAQTKAAGIGSRQNPYGTTKVTTKNPATTTGGILGFGGSTVPGNTTTVETPNAAPLRQLPAVGTVDPATGYTYLGGDPNNQASWRK